MMTREQYLMVQAMEECDEISQRVSKALRFGMLQVQPGQELTNRMRIRQELSDLIAVLDMLDPNLVVLNYDELNAKKAKVEKYLEFSFRCGRGDAEGTHP